MTNATGVVPNTQLSPTHSHGVCPRRPPGDTVEELTQRFDILERDHREWVRYFDEHLGLLEEEIRTRERRLGLRLGSG
ncbi:MAG: hypothetical protein OXG27_06330 [Chloroflexi bacterium]|nr:hypothetical protein [Chloroflexota bacterium]